MFCGITLQLPGPQQKRFAAYMEGLAQAAGHQDRQQPLKSYCKGLLLPGERKSIEPMAAHLDPARTQPMRQSLHHLVAKAPWNDAALLEQVRNQVLPVMEKQGILDPFLGQVQPIGDRQTRTPRRNRKTHRYPAGRRDKTEVPGEIKFQTKPEIALDQIREAVTAKVARGVVLADAAYGINTEFREQLTKLELQYVVGIQSSMTVWEPGKQPLPAAQVAGPALRIGPPTLPIATCTGRVYSAGACASCKYAPPKSTPTARMRFSCTAETPLRANISETLLDR